MGTTNYFMPRRLGHANLLVSDTDTSMNFYNSIVGFEEAYRVVAIQGGFLSNGNTHHDIGMIQSSGPAGHNRNPGLNHLAFELETEVDLVEGYEKAIRDDIKFERTLDHDIAHSVYIADPDGNSCEIYADVVRDWRNARHGLVTKPKPKWWPGLTTPSSERNYDADPEIRIVENAVFHPRRTKHATLVVQDLPASVKFYTNRIGLTVNAEGSHYVMLGGTCGENNITLIQSHSSLPFSFHHVGLELNNEKDLEQSLIKLTKQNISIEAQIDHPLRRAVFLRDPDGILLQFFVDRVDYDDPRWCQLDPNLALWLA